MGEWLHGVYAGIIFATGSMLCIGALICIGEVLDWIIERVG